MRGYSWAEKKNQVYLLSAGVVAVLLLALVGNALGLFGGKRSADSATGSQQSRTVNSANFAGWPLTVDSGTLACDGSGGVGKVTFTIGSVRYAVNGLAKGSAGTADITPIWADSPTIAGAKKDITPLIDAGLLLCR